jgi:hypothetical protein
MASKLHWRQRSRNITSFEKEIHLSNDELNAWWAKVKDMPWNPGEDHISLQVPRYTPLKRNQK